MNADAIIFYSTVTGRAERIAVSISKKYNIIKPIEIDEVNNIKINKVGHLILIISTTRVGKAPESYTKFLRINSLEEYIIKHFINRITILALGDSNFSNFCQAGMDIYNKLIIDKIKIHIDIIKFDAKKNDHNNDSIWESHLDPFFENQIFAKLIDLDKEDTCCNLSHISDIDSQDEAQQLHDNMEVKLVLIKNVTIDTPDYLHHLVFEIKQNKHHIKPIDIIVRGRFYTVANYSDRYIDVFVNPIGKISKYLCDMQVAKSIKARLSVKNILKDVERYVVTGTGLSMITRMLYDKDHVYNVNDIMIGLRNKKIYAYYYTLFPYLSMIKSKIYYSRNIINKKSNRITLNKIKRYFKIKGKDYGSIEMIGHRIDH